MKFKKRWLIYMIVPGVNVIWLLSILIKELYKVVETLRGIRTDNIFSKMREHYQLTKTCKVQQERTTIATFFALALSLLFSMSCLNCISAGIFTPVPILAIGAVIFATAFIVLGLSVVRANK